MYQILISVCLLCCFWTPGCLASDPQQISIVYFKQQVKRPPVLSNLQVVAEDEGFAGAHLAIEDSNTTGKFIRQNFLLQEIVVDAQLTPIEVASRLTKLTSDFIVLDLPAASLEAVIKSEQDTNRLLINVAAADNQFRVELCSKNLLHTLPSRAMLTDALTQYLVKKRWTNWALIEGTMQQDKKYANALRRSAKKFGAKIVTQKSWDGGRDARRSAQAEVPLLTQGMDYDVLLVADELGDFGEYLMYRTWEPRVVAGTQGLFATSWYWTIEQWGAAQLQRRFKKLAGRSMTDKDYAAWVAIRSISEGAARTKSSTIKTITDFIHSPQFELAAFKGRKLSYRPWSGQLRQPIALTAAHSLVSQSPQEGFLHRFSELDTLGFDQPEVSCKRK